jgi:hypothetical protein
MITLVFNCFDEQKNDSLEYFRATCHPANKLAFLIRKELRNTRNTDGIDTAMLFVNKTIKKLMIISMEILDPIPELCSDSE